MSILVAGLTKYYGQQLAVNDISFELKKGEIVGFLGPNGAGKSTTMKMIMGYIPPSSGQAVVLGKDVTRFPKVIRKKVGYLPEHNPLYLDMYVHEFLRFSAELFDLKNVKKRVGETIELCGLALEQNKKVGALSKGYRQRVGLAQALLPDPEVLILDEPTTGLDPNQVLEVRSLIKDISSERTTLFSSHILQEVEAVCNKVMIINKGSLLENSSIPDLQQKYSSASRVEIAFEKEIALEIIEALTSVNQIIKKDNGTFIIDTADPMRLREDLKQLSIQYDNLIQQFNKSEKNLEQIFQEITNAPRP